MRGGRGGVFSTISVIVACKNEAQNIPHLINALSQQTYPCENFEVVLADDASTDDTAQVIKSMITELPNFHYHYVQPTSYPEIVGKKKAITSAINIAKGKIFAFTDADCIPAPQWLADINNAIVGEYDFYAGYSPLLPHITHCTPHTAFPLKNLERASIFAVCAAGFSWKIPITCTARNMAYTRSLWEKTEGFAGINHIRSGDDDLMLHKMSRYIQKYYFSFNPQAVVPSIENKDLSTQVESETRRTSKFIYYPLYIKLLVLTIAIFYALLLINIGHYAVSLCTDTIPPADIIIALTTKLALEFTLLAIFLSKVRQLKLLFYFPLAEILYIPYFIFFGIRGTFGRYKWKS